MKTFLTKFPWFYLLIGIYPLLFLWANNRTEVDPAGVLRPMLVTLLGLLVLFAILSKVLRDVFKAALLGSLTLMLFFSYGRIYYWLRDFTRTPFVSRHRFLVLVFVVVFVLGAWGLIKGASRIKEIQPVLNLAAVVLVMMPGFQVGWYYFSSFIASRQSVNSPSALNISSGELLPDVYYIILDSYMRSDALQADLGFDNGPFIRQLQQLGFYVADCSRPNYEYTRDSLVSSLNMDYEQSLLERYQGVAENGFFAIIENNAVRRQLKQAGYKTVSFETPFALTDWNNADVFFTPGMNGAEAGLIQPFEAVYLKSTAFLLINDLYVSSRPAGQPISLSGIEFPYQVHVDLVLDALDQLPNVPKISGHKFVFAHILVPHFPYVFSPSGDILTDPGFFGGINGDGINDGYRVNGYLDAVQFIDNRIIPVLKNIISGSAVPPVIILQGDHGMSGNNRGTNLNAYYLPKGSADLYPSITPVNSFRVVLDDYFGADYPLLPDITYDLWGAPAAETYPKCVY